MQIFVLAAVRNLIQAKARREKANQISFKDREEIQFRQIKSCTNFMVHGPKKPSRYAASRDKERRIHEDLKV